MLCWIILFAMVTGSFGKYLGIPYLFLDPEYLNEVNFRSFFIMGSVLAGFTTGVGLKLLDNQTNIKEGETYGSQREFARLLRGTALQAK